MKIYGYCASYYDAALVILDLSKPTLPRLLGTLRGGGSPNYLEYPYGIVVDYPYAYVIDNAYNDGFNIYDIKDPSNIIWKGGIHLGDGQDPGSDFRELYTIIKSGNTVYIASTHSGLLIVDVSDITAPLLIGHYSDRRGYHMALSGTTLYMSTGDAFVILDVSDPANIVELSYTSGAGSPNYLNNARGLAINGTALYVCAEVDDAVTCWDVTNPAAPSQRDVLRGSGAPPYLNYAQVIVIRGNYAYIGKQGTTVPGLTVIDITDPTSMAYHGGVYSTDYLWSPWDIRLFGRHVYIAGYFRGATIIDISNPAAPVIKGNIQGAGSPNYLEYVGGMDIHVFGVKGNPHIDQRMFQHVERMGR